MIVRFERNGKVKYGWTVEEENKVRVIEGEICRGREGQPAIMTGLELPLDQIRLLAPFSPGRVVFADVHEGNHGAGKGRGPHIDVKESPFIFGPEEAIVHPKQANRLHFAGDLAVVIKREADRIKADAADEYILGFTCAIYGTARNEAFCSLGPTIVPKLDYHDLRIVTKVNGRVWHDTSTGKMEVLLPQLLEMIAGVMPLLPGDLVLLGTSVGSPVVPGDEISVSIEGIGSLTNRIVGE